MGKTVTIERRRRGFFGTIFKWLFILFNLLMGWWLVTYWLDAGKTIADGHPGDAQTGAFIGAMIGTGFLIVFWIAGAGILGCLALATRGKKVITQQVSD